ncbi:MAG: hypothetical protein ACLRT4_00295 [Thomasclavelia sp.]
MYCNLYITIKAKEKFDDSIIDPITFILMEWGVDGKLIDWDIYPKRAKLEVNTEDNNYLHYSITYQGMQNIMDLCYDYEFIMTIIDNDNHQETYTTYASEFNSINFETDVSYLII